MISSFVYVLYLVLLGIWGIVITGFLFRPKNWTLLYLTTALILGLTSGTSMTYLLAILGDALGIQPIYFGTLAFVGLIFGLLTIPRLRKYLQRIRLRVSWFERFVLLGCGLLATYLMMKTFRTDGTGQLLIARNLVFDVAHQLSIIRAFSIQQLIPYQSPFISGTDHIYHFLFAFFAGIAESMGVPIALAYTIPSVLGFSLLLLTGYSVVTEHWQLGKSIGLVAILVLVLQSSLSSLLVLPKLFQTAGGLSRLWNFPDYPFAGPFDGSIISIFTTINVFVNQRHLPFVLSLFVLSFFLIDQLKSKMKLLTFGIVLGSLLTWHVSLIPLLVVCLGIHLIAHKKFRDLWYLVVGVVLGASPYLFLWSDSLGNLLINMSSLSKAIQETTSQSGSIWVAKFLLLNGGVLWFFALIGVATQWKRIKLCTVPLVFIGSYFLWQLHHGMIDQKLWSVLLVLMKLISLLGLATLLDLKKMRFFIVIIFLLGFSSGLLDLLVIKNDFLLTIPDREQSKIMQYLDTTPVKSVYLSDQEMFDPIVLAGRSSYLGFFQQTIFQPQEVERRATTVKNIITASTSASLKQSMDPMIDYVLITKQSTTAHKLEVNQLQLITTYPVVFEDNKAIIVQVKKTSL